MLEAEHAVLQRDHARSKEELRALRQQHEALRQQHEALRQQLRASESERARLVDLHTAVTLTFESAQDKVFALQDDLRAAETKHSNLRADYDRLAKADEDAAAALARARYFEKLFDDERKVSGMAKEMNHTLHGKVTKGLGLQRVAKEAMAQSEKRAVAAEKSAAQFKKLYNDLLRNT